MMALLLPALLLPRIVYAVRDKPCDTLAVPLITPDEYSVRPAGRLPDDSQYMDTLSPTDTGEIGVMVAPCCTTTSGST